MLGLEQKPSPHEFLQIAGDGKRKGGVNVIAPLFSLSSAICDERKALAWWCCSLKEDSMGKLTNNTLVPSWQRLPAWTAVGVEAGATHVGSDGHGTKNKLTQYSKRIKKLQTYLS